MKNTPDATAEEDYGFFTDLPAVTAAGEETAYGPFDDAPGMPPPGAAAASQSMRTDCRGAGAAGPQTRQW